ncbi:MAG TPA: hypothetical protein VNQ33_00885 [Acidimicrobiales bacterium]|nr:hypothetical protein [Acidimicrobiales bacterium]
MSASLPDGGRPDGFTHASIVADVASSSAPIPNRAPPAAPPLELSDTAVSPPNSGLDTPNVICPGSAHAV